MMNENNSVDYKWRTWLIIDEFLIFFSFSPYLELLNSNHHNPSSSLYTLNKNF